MVEKLSAGRRRPGQSVFVFLWRKPDDDLETLRLFIESPSIRSDKVRACAVNPKTTSSVSCSGEPSVVTIVGGLGAGCTAIVSTSVADSAAGAPK
jgi:hypothetical protein